MLYPEVDNHKKNNKDKNMALIEWSFFL